MKYGHFVDLASFTNVFTCQVMSACTCGLLERSY